MTVSEDVLAQRVNEILEDPKQSREVVIAAARALISMQVIRDDPKSKPEEAAVAGITALYSALFGEKLIGALR